MKIIIPTMGAKNKILSFSLSALLLFLLKEIVFELLEFLFFLSYETTSNKRHQVHEIQF